MRVNGKRKIEKFYKKHSRAKGPLLSWLAEAEGSSWLTTHDIKERYADASFLEDNLVIFNIGGNKFRLEVIVRFCEGIVFIDDINTHANYDKKNKKR